ncbi:MAG: hypothetical protein K1X39_06430 [Thermoflexales bacterium]|nr:hypothetical protein [Thermoflexales bacterium]
MIDLRAILDLLLILRRRLWLVALPVIAALIWVLLGARGSVSASGYTTSMRFAAGLPPERTAGVYNYDRHYDWLASEYMAQAFAYTVPTEAFASAVARRLQNEGLQVAPAALAAALRGDHTSSIFRVTLAWPDAAQLARIAEAASAELTENAAAYWPQLSNPGGAPVRRLDLPDVVASAPSLRASFDVPVKLLLGLAVGVALAFLAHALDPALRDRRDLDRLGLRALAHIPR